MSEQDEIMQIAQSLVAAEPKPAAAPAETAPTEPAKAVEPKTGAEGAGKGDAKPVVEVKPEEKKPEPEKPKTDWREAARREREKQRERQQGKQSAAALQQQLQQAQAKLAEWQEFERLKAENPLEAAKKVGLHYDTLTKKYIEGLEKNPSQTPPEVERLIQNFHQLEEVVKGLRSELVEERRQKVVNGFETEVRTLLEAKGDEFELTRTAEEGPRLVRAIVAAHWSKTVVRDEQGRIVEDGETMPTEEACKKAEEFFEKKQLERFAKTKKFAALAKPPEPPKVEEKKTTTSTLTQSLLHGGGETQRFSGEFEELAALAKRLESQMGN